MFNQHSGFTTKKTLITFKKMLTGLQGRALLNQLETLYEQLKQSGDKYSYSGLDEWLPFFYYLIRKIPFVFPAVHDDIQVNQRKENVLFKQMFDKFSRLYAYNCSKELNLLQQYFIEQQYNNGTNTDEINIKMAAYLKCLNDGTDLANLEDLPITFLKDLFFSFLFEKYSKLLQAHIVKMKNETAKTGNGFKKSNLEKSSNYFGDVENMSEDFINNFLGFHLQHHSIHLSKPHQIIQKEIIKKILFNIYFKMITSTVNDYLDLRKILIHMSSRFFFTNQFGSNNDSFSAEMLSSEESLYNVSFGCNDILHNMLTNIMNSSSLGKILYTINNNLLFYYNISEEEIVRVLPQSKSCFSPKTVEKVLLNLKAYAWDNDGTNFFNSVTDFLKIHCSSLDIKRNSKYNSVLFPDEEMASIYFLTFILQKFTDDFLNNPFKNLFDHSQFDANFLKPMCEFIEALTIPVDKEVTMKDINIMLLNYVNRFQEDISSESRSESNVTSEHVEPVLFFIISRYAAQNITYARNLCSLLKYPDHASRDSEYFVILGIDNPLEFHSISILCRVISKTTDYHIFQKEYFDILAMAYNLTHMLSHFGEETIRHSSDNINMSFIHFLTRQNISIRAPNQENRANTIFTENEIIKILLKKVMSFDKFLKLQGHILPKNIFPILYLVHSIMDNQIMNTAENQKHEILGSLLNIFLKEYYSFEHLLLYLINNYTGSTDDGDNYDTENVLILEKIRNKEFASMLQNKIEMFIKVLNEAKRNKSISFLLNFIKQHYVYNNTGHLTLPHIIGQLKSLSIDHAEVMQFVTNFSKFSSWLEISEVHDENYLKQQIFYILQIAKALMSTYQLPFKSLQQQTVTHFIEYLEEGLINPQK